MEFKRQIYFPEYSYGNQIKSDFKRSKFELGKVLISEFIPVNRPCNCNCSIPSFTGSFPGSDHILTFNSITFPGIFLGIDFSALEFEPLLVPSGFTSVPPVCVCALDITLLDDGSTVTCTIGRLQKKKNIKRLLLLDYMAMWNWLQKHITNIHQCLWVGRRWQYNQSFLAYPFWQFCFDSVNIMYCIVQ